MAECSLGPSGGQGVGGEVGGGGRSQGYGRGRQELWQGGLGSLLLLFGVGREGEERKERRRWGEAGGRRW